MPHDCLLKRRRFFWSLKGGNHWNRCSKGYINSVRSKWECCLLERVVLKVILHLVSHFHRFPSDLIARCTMHLDPHLLALAMRSTIRFRWDAAHKIHDPHYSASLFFWFLKWYFISVDLHRNCWGWQYLATEGEIFVCRLFQTETATFIISSRWRRRWFWWEIKWRW